MEHIDAELHHLAPQEQIGAERKSIQEAAQAAAAEARRREIEEKTIAEKLAKELIEIHEEFEMLSPKHMHDRTQIIVPAMKASTEDDVISEYLILEELEDA